ncbi:MAG: UDP-N-acetylmuramoyl-L-alanyl-D-glutamate--2,6-diaminopimelate ligase [Planctomycetota bacterium]
MRLRELLPVLCPSDADRRRLAAHADLEIKKIVQDHRLVRPGSLFIARRGQTADGHKFIPQAVRAGAVAVVSEQAAPGADAAVHLVLPDVRERVAPLAARFYGDPTERLHVTGITGTNGKTSTAFRLRTMLAAAGRPTGLLGTIHYKIGDRVIPAGNTTPDGLLIQDLFRQMVDAGLDHAVIEVSSHALVLGRVEHVRFDVALFTCLSDREHLDFHRTFERYRDAKARLFEMLPPAGCAVLNADDPLAGFMADRAPRSARRLWFGRGADADVRGEILDMDMTGTTYRLESPAGAAEIRTPFVGEFNVANDLAAAAAGSAAGLRFDEIVAGLRDTTPVPGRLERIPAPDIHPLVDYAHNEGAFDSVLGAVAPLAGRRLLVVFGCGGDRDRSKRPAMGAVAEKYADHIFLTADNSRSEQTDQIIREIELGMVGSKPRTVIPDRARAIRAAVAAAEPGDTLVVAGKGHETYQILGRVKAPFDDRDVLRRAVADRVRAQNAVPTESTRWT